MILPRFYTLTSGLNLGEYYIDQIITRGVRPKEILDAVKNPLNIKAGRDNVMRYIGRHAEIRLNSDGEIVTGIRFKGPE